MILNVCMILTNTESVNLGHGICIFVLSSQYPPMRVTNLHLVEHKVNRVFE